MPQGHSQRAGGSTHPRHPHQHGSSNNSRHHGGGGGRGAVGHHALRPEAGALAGQHPPHAQRWCSGFMKACSAHWRCVEGAASKHIAVSVSALAGTRTICYDCLPCCGPSLETAPVVQQHAPPECSMRPAATRGGVITHECCSSQYMPVPRGARARGEPWDRPQQGRRASLGNCPAQGRWGPTSARHASPLPLPCPPGPVTPAHTGPRGGGQCGARAGGWAQRC